jgi:hypothetical protein
VRLVLHTLQGQSLLVADRAEPGAEGPHSAEPDAAGKTTLVDRLAAALPIPVPRLSAADFLRPRDES